MTVASVARDWVSANSSVPAWTAETVVDVGLAAGTGEADGAGALEAVDEVVADTAVHAGVHLALVYVHFALRTRESWKRVNH